jgi:predicted ABC-class ATPase
VVFHVKHAIRRLSGLGPALRALDGRGYKAYKAIEGPYEDGGLRLYVDHVQGDPFADPSRVRVRIRAGAAGLPSWARASPDRRRACADFLNRSFAGEAGARSESSGSGRSGEILVLVPGQEVLSRTSVEVGPDGAVEARFRIGLPARGRRILGPSAAEAVGRALEAVRSSLFFAAVSSEGLRAHVEAVEDAVALRAQLAERGLVAFVADGSILPRRSGVDDRPLGEGRAVRFSAPESLRCTLTAPNAGPVVGLGIQRGITLIVGGGYHGKSTLLRALERGVYDHVPGDGRERVVTVARAAKVRAEDGRGVAGTDISNFVAGLPDGTDTQRFETGNASGSTSQAAAIVEALEAGAEALLLDEDTSATNFMIRDGRMQRLIGSEDEPITPFIDRARALFTEAGVSTILVVGGSGDYFDVADQVIAMRHYRPADMTAAARRVAGELPTERQAEGGAWQPIRRRRVDPTSIDPSLRHRELSIRVLSRDRVRFGAERVDLAAVEQLVEDAQTRAIAHAIARARAGALDGYLPLGEAVEALVAEVEREGLGIVHPYEIGELAAFRGLEVAAFLNRLRTLRTLVDPEAPPVTSASGGSDE